MGLGDRGWGVGTGGVIASYLSVKSFEAISIYEIPLFISLPTYRRGAQGDLVIACLPSAPPFWMKAYMQYKYIKDKRLPKRAGSGRRIDFSLFYQSNLFRLSSLPIGERIKMSGRLYGDFGIGK